MAASLDTGGAGLLETSDVPAWEITSEFVGSIDHHDGFQPSLPRESQFRHSGWAAQRLRIYKSLLRTGQSCRRVRHFADCGSALWLARDGQQLELLCNRCHDRLCLPCQKQRQAAVVEGIMLRMIDSDTPCRFLTFTLRHSDAPLGVQIDRLLASFKTLRRHPEMRSRLDGGAWFLEVKLSKDKARWHPHLHVVAAGAFIPQKDLSRCWLQVTGDSYICDIQAIGDPRKRAAYVTKYSTKPLHNEVTQVPAKLDEFVTCIKGRRLYQCFGSWSRAVVRTKPSPRKLEALGRLDSILSDALGGCVQSLVLLHQAYHRWPALRKSHPLPREWMPPPTAPPPAAPPPFPDAVEGDF